MALNGHCLCGAVTFTAEQADLHYHACHCGMCQRWSTGPVFGTSADGVRFAGEKHVERYASSEWAERGFCKRCGTHLFFYLKAAQRYILMVGAFDDPAAFTLAGEIYVDRKPPGYDFAGDHARLTEAEFLAKFAAPSV